MYKLGEELRKRRQQRGLTQEKMAMRVEVHRTTYVRYERGDVQPSLETLCRLAEVLECTTDTLLGRE